MQAIAAAARGITAVVGFIDLRSGARATTAARIRKYNAAAVVRDGRVLQRARKSLLPSYRYFDDKRFFSPAERREPVDARAPAGRVRLGVSICEDLWDEFYDVKPLPELAAKGAERAPQPQRVAVLSGQAPRRATRLIRAHIRRLGKAARLRQHRRRRRQRQEHHPVRRREPRLRRAPGG